MEFRELFEETLKDVYYAEKLALRRMPKMADGVASDALAEAFELHEEQTEGQVKRLEQVFDMLGMKPKGKRCAAMEGLVAEAEELLEEQEESTVRDAGILAAAQAMEHYEISRYGTLKSWAEKMGEDEIAKLLDETLQEEKQTDQKLTELAESEINIEALEEGEEGGAGKGKPASKAKSRMQDDDEEEGQQKSQKPMAAAAKKGSGGAAKSGGRSKGANA
jgi:ferritin-like metal-binding protein YciE